MKLKNLFLSMALAVSAMAAVAQTDFLVPSRCA